MKKFILILSLILLAFVVKGQDSTMIDVEPVLIEKKLSFVEDKMMEKGYVEYYEIFVKGENTPLRATIITSHHDKPYYVVEEMLFKGTNLTYYSSKKISNGTVETEVKIILTSGFATITINGTFVVDKSQREAFLNKIGYTLYIINDKFLKIEE